ncbi:MAG: outer membrane lipoprotein carrier protein LolA [Gemmatimonadota bacterium]|nr:outer membrane lipoprotein carrier protein LolA [Gemmatimonadota bacterium]
MNIDVKDTPMPALRCFRPRSAPSSAAQALRSGGLGGAVVALLLLHAVPSAAQDRGLSVIERAGDRYASVETVCADFTQRLEVPLLGSERTGTGRLCTGRPNLFAMRFADPAGDLIVVDGDFAWVYFPSNDAKTVLKTTAERSAGGRDFHREFLVDPSSKYDVAYEAEEMLDGRATHRIRMRPKGPASYRAAVLWIDDGAPVLRRLRLEEENGNVRTITLADVVFGADVGIEWFTFTPPEGALVMEPGTRGGR